MAQRTGNSTFFDCTFRLKRSSGRLAEGHLKPTPSGTETPWSDSIRVADGNQISMGVERRKYHRIGTDQVISFAEVDHSDQLAVSKNLSTGGISFEAVGVEIGLGDTLRVTFNIGDHTVVAIGRVVWCVETDLITQEVGIEFHEIDPEAVRLLEEEIESPLTPVGLH